MWALVNIRWRIGIIVSVAGAYAAVLAFMGLIPLQETGFAGKALFFLSPIGLTVITGYLIGIWKQAWIAPASWGLGKMFFPDLNGHWQGRVDSSHARKDPDASYELELRIDQSWGRIEVANDGKRGVSDSTQILCKPDRHNGRPCLYVMFEGRATVVSDTDSERFLGAERITYNSDTGELTGEYMTDRAWMRGDNTAGKFRLKRLEGDQAG